MMSQDDEHHSRVGSKSLRAVRCVLLVAADDPPPTDLLDRLNQRGAQVAVVPDAPAALAELASRAANTLIVHQPGRHERLAKLIQVVQHYFPQVVCRQYAAAPAVDDDTTQSPLRPLTDLFTDGAENNQQSTPVTQVPPPITMDVSAPLITDDELQMLIGDTPTEDDPTRAPGADEGEARR